MFYLPRGLWLQNNAGDEAWLRGQRSLTEGDWDQKLTACSHEENTTYKHEQPLSLEHLFCLLGLQTLNLLIIMPWLQPIFCVRSHTEESN